MINFRAMSASDGRVSPATIAIAGAFIGVVGGVLATIGSAFILAAFIGCIVGLSLLFSPRALFYTCFSFSMVLCGLAEFYLHVGQANWVASGLCILLAVAVGLARVGQISKAPSLKGTAMGNLVVAYILMMLISCLFNQVSFAQFLVGARNYFPFIAVYAFFVFSAKDRDLKFVPYIIILIAALQLPFCLHEYFFVGKLREQSLKAVGGASEAIVGTFGGDQFGGGYTGEMAVFMLLASCAAISTVLKNKWFRLLANLIPIFAIICVGLAETKIVFLLMPVAVSIVMWPKIRSSPKYFFGLLFVGGGAFLVLAAVYYVRYWSVSDGEFLHAFTYSFDPNFMVDERHRGRIAALIHWWNSNTSPIDLPHLGLGYGMGSTLENSRVLGEGNAVVVYGMGLNAHAASSLLWDAGIVGFLLFFSIVLKTIHGASLVLAKGGAKNENFLRVAIAAMVCFIAMLPYQPSVVGGPPMQFLFWLFVGFVEREHRGVLNQDGS